MSEPLSASEADELYFDHAATTPVDPAVAARVSECLCDPRLQGNPSSTGHRAGRRARALVESARVQLAAAVGADPAGIVFTSGATESDNLAVLGAARFNAHRGRHVVSAKTEHKAVLDALALLGRDGFEITLLKPANDGIVQPDQVAAALREDTVLVSLMQVNTEIGVIQDVAAVGRLCRERGVLLHVDAAQSVGKIRVDVDAMQADLVSFSAHKAYGPKGIGALWIRPQPRVGLEPLLRGGGQERGLRSGTLATHQIVGMAAAFAIAAEQLETDSLRIGALGRRLLAGLEAIGGIELNGHRDQRVPGIVNVAVHGVEGESLRLALDGIALSSGSACATASDAGSYVLRALGRSDLLAESSLRFSLGRHTSEADVDAALAIAARGIARLRALAPA
ncbi:MAG TPA: aminotransferase class V-fold PLP-dependent enzyme [Steroidobacteraceae bacterium]|nr:aminotransferase class V-fold PLP-dependent enzyme [Steroidobacteraceae bacterium]